MGDHFICLLKESLHFQLNKHFRRTKVLKITSASDYSSAPVQVSVGSGTMGLIQQSIYVSNF